VRRGLLWAWLVGSVGVILLNAWRAWAVPGEVGVDLFGLVGGLGNA
jgi:hypothetical protein